MGTKNTCNKRGYLRQRIPRVPPSEASFKPRNSLLHKESKKETPVISIISVRWLACGYRLRPLTMMTSFCRPSTNRRPWSSTRQMSPVRRYLASDERSFLAVGRQGGVSFGVEGMVEEGGHAGSARCRG